MNKQAASLIFFIAIMAAGCVGHGSQTMPSDLTISFDRDRYTPLMSSAVGIGLTPEYPSDIDNMTIEFRWHTDQGYFLSWDSPDFKVENEGKDVTTGDRKVFWSYSPEDMDKDKPPVIVTLSMIEKATGKVMETASIEIGWEEKHYAVVKKA